MTLNLPHLREVAMAATPGSWEAETWCSDHANSWAARGPDHEQDELDDELNPCSEAALAAERDAAYIAQFNPQTALALLDRLAKAEMMIEDLLARLDSRQALEGNET